VSREDERFLLRLGLLSFGIGERINHPMRSEMERGKIAGSSITIESNPRDPNSLGTAGAFQNERFLVIGVGY